MRKELLVKSNVANVCYLLISIFVEIASDKQEDMGGNRSLANRSWGTGVQCRSLGNRTGGVGVQVGSAWKSIARCRCVMPFAWESDARCRCANEFRLSIDGAVQVCQVV